MPTPRKERDDGIPIRRHTRKGSSFPNWLFVAAIPAGLAVLVLVLAIVNSGRKSANTAVQAKAKSVAPTSPTIGSRTNSSSPQGRESSTTFADGDSSSDVGLWVGGSFVVLLAVGGIVVWVVSVWSCSKCGAWWSVYHVESVVTGTSKAYGMVPRVAYTTTHGRAADGKPVTLHSQTTHHERVPVIHTSHEHKYRCRRCRHNTYTKSMSTNEDFSRP